MSDRLKKGYEMSHPDSGDEVLITGLSGHFAESDSVAELQKNLFDKINLITRDERRWRIFDTDIPQEIGKINDLKNFDASFFGVDYKMAHNVNLMSRLLLERTYEAIIDAGMNPAEFQNTRTGIFTGCCYYESEKKLLYDKLHCNNNGVNGCSHSMLGLRIAQWLGTAAPAYTFDSACASSINSLEQGFKAIRSGVCDAAIVCGVNVCLYPYMSQLFASLGILSPEGRCKSFDNSANGYVRSEAVVVCLLQRAKDSRRAYAQMVYAKLNCDGYKENSITYPAGDIQRCLLEDFYEECDIPASTVEYFEAHGTGTTVGDPEELNAIDVVMCKGRTKPLLIGSVKSIIGHTEASSGLCATVKLCIAYHTGYIPPNIHYSEPRNGIPALTEGRFKVITEKQPWNCGLACFSSMGFGGANCHILLRNFNKEKVNNGIPNDNLPRLVCISGRNKSAVELVLNSFNKKSIDAEEIRLWHAIHEKNIKGHMFRGIVLLKSTPNGTVTFARDVARYKNTQPYICLIYPTASTQLVNVKGLMDIPKFASAIYKCDAALKSNNINLIDIITGNQSVSTNYLHLCITTVAVQIGFTDVIRSIDIKVDSFLGYGIGELGCDYAKGILNAEEAMEIAYSHGMVLMEAPTANGNKNEKVISKKEQVLEHTNGHAGNKVYHWSHNDKINRITSNKDFFSDEKVNFACSFNDPCGAEDIVPLIPSNAIIINITTEHSFNYTLKKHLQHCEEIKLLGENTQNAVQDLFTGLGRLYMGGVNFKIAELYPHVSFPVSQSTPMLSHLVAWDHRETWYRDLFHEEITKLTAVERVVTISMDNLDLNYLDGHRVGGRHLYPESGYLVLVWQTLAMMHACEYKEFSVVFEKIQYLRATTIPKNGEIEFRINIHPVSGEFQVTENNTVVSTGIIYPKQKDEQVFELLSSSESDSNSGNIKLSQKDFYREMKLRDYDREGVFKGVLDSNVDGSCSRVTWTNNWIVYIDYIFQLIASSTDTRNLYLLTSCAKLSIDTHLHYKILAKTTEITSRSSIDVFIDNDTQVTRSGGLEVRGFKSTMVSSKADLNIPTYEKYKFIANYGRDLVIFEEIIRIYVDVIIENTQVHKLKAIELIDEEYKRKKKQPVLEYVAKILEAMPLVRGKLDIVKNYKNIHNVNNTEEFPTHINEISKLPEDKSAVLFVGANLSQKEQVLKQTELYLRVGGFLISREDDVTSIGKLNDKFDIIAVHNTRYEVVVLFKKKTEVENKVFIKIDTFDQSFLWIPKLKEATEQSKKIVLYANEDTSGIIGLVNCLRKEPGGDKIQCLLVIDHDKPSFDAEIQLYKIQLDKNVAFNILKDGQWGTYRHFEMKNPDLVKPSLHAYLNIETIGDLSSIKWLEGNLGQNTQEKDDNLLFVHVYNSALNFRDIVTATGRVSVDAVARGRLAQQCVQGLEFAGRLANGTRVAGMAGQSISNVLFCNKNLMMLIPNEWTFDEAASVMVAYSTVFMAFDVLGYLQPGESVLIHAGSGAVGQAAINVALRRGCKVFTTVGTSEKIDFIKKLYPQLKDNHIGNSRDTSFLQMIMAQTNGKGVDLLLNSLSEEKILASVRCLGRKGRFLEMGKYDIFKNTPIEMSLHKKEISFHAVTLDCIFESTTYRRKLMELLTKGIANGEVRPLTHCIFEKQEVEAAYRYMGSGKHIGKVIIKIRNEEDEKIIKPKPMLIGAHRRYTCCKDHVYILVGGLGGFGLELADWLVLRGARKLVMVSSRGLTTGYQARRIRVWTSYGADIRILTDDVATESGCKTVLETAVTMGHVEAIFNLAAVLNDALFQNLTPELFQKSFKPKSLATFYLDMLSRNMCQGLRDFVVFSSVACGRGNSGQSNYGLANSVMERICEKRKKDGLPGLAIQWGAIGDVGMLAELQADTCETEVAGTVPQKISSCLQSLDTVMMQKNAIISTYVLAHKKVTKNIKKTAVEAVAQIIGVNNLNAVSNQASLTELGMDSITATEVKQVLERDFDIFLTAQKLRTTSLSQLTSLSQEKQNSTSNATSTFAQVEQYKDNYTFDLRCFLRNFGEEENAYKPFIIMPSGSFNNDKNMKNKSAKTLFMIPGLEGFASTYEPLCHQLHTKACVLQLPFNNREYDLQDVTEELYKVIKPLKENTSSFNLLGYSYGTIPLLALAAKLESEGHMGTVFCIDGSPTWIRSLFKNWLNFTDDVKLQNQILKHVFEAVLPNNNFITKLIEKVSELYKHDAKVDYVIENLPIDLKYSNDFIKKICNASNERLQIVKNYNVNGITKIKSPIVLIRTETGVMHDFAENYELDKFTEGDVIVHYLKQNHVSILEDANCARIIEEYLNVL